MLRKVIDYFTGRGKTLTLRLKYPESKRVTFEHIGAKKLTISDEPNKVFVLDSLIIKTDKASPRVSNGAIAGASVAALRGKDILKGAVIGDFFEKQNNHTAKTYQFTFKEESGQEERVITAKLTDEQANHVKQFFGRR